MSRDLIHGGALDAMRAAYPDAPEPWIDLSTGINPWPYPYTALSPSALTDLPLQTDQDACRLAMAAAFRAHAPSILLAPGSELLIRLLPDVLQPKRVAILSPTYGDHRAAWRRAGVDIIETDEPLNLAASVDLVVVTHPNNPDGRVFAPEALETARQTLARRGGWLIIDEAYADLVPDQSLATHGGADGLIVLRSFGKFFGLAGVRLGALLAPEHIRTAMAGRLGAWPVSGAALQIGAEAYANTDWQTQTRQTLSSVSARLKNILRAGGLDLIGGTSLFQYVSAPDAHYVFEHLAHAGIYVRRFEHSATHLRMGLPSTSAAEDRLAEALSLLT
ncbi:MAG: threonine-phosphate decarboxylase CobD [Pseudomonadota bacterium]